MTKDTVDPLVNLCFSHNHVESILNKEMLCAGVNAADTLNSCVCMGLQNFYNFFILLWLLLDCMGECYSVQWNP